MPLLDWLNKNEAVRATQKVPYRLLKAVPELGAGDPNAENLLIQGDNLEALKALLPLYAGKVKCIYIDRLTTPARRLSIMTTTWSIPSG